VSNISETSRQNTSPGLRTEAISVALPPFIGFTFLFFMGNYSATQRPKEEISIIE